MKGGGRKWGKTCSTGPRVGIKHGLLWVRPSLDGAAALPGELYAAPQP